MRYKLSEALILNERFILCEATATPAEVNTQCKKTLGNLTKLTSIINEQDAKNDTSKYNSLKNEAQTLAVEAGNATDPAIVKSKINQFISTVNSLKGSNPWSTDTKINNEMDSYIAGISNLATSNNFDKSTISSLKQNTDGIVGAMLMVSMGADDSSLENKDALESAIKLIAGLENITDSGSSTLPDFTALLSDLKSLDTAITTALSDDSKIQAALTQCLTFNSTYRPLITANSTDASKANAEKTLNNTKYTNMDWESQYKKATDKEAFWKEYYPAAWKDAATTIERLGEPFKNECIRLGFKRNSNPFIAFIEDNVIKGAKLPINHSSWAIMHNGYIHQQIKPDNLRGRPNKLGLIFSKSFHNGNRSEAELEDLLFREYQINNFAATLPEELGNDTTTAKTYQLLANNGLIIDIADHTTTPNVGMRLAPTILYDNFTGVAASSAGLKIRPTSTIKDLISEILGNDMAMITFKAWGDSTTKKLLRSIKNNTKAAKILRSLLLTYKTDKEVEKWIAKVTDRATLTSLCGSNTDFIDALQSCSDDWTPTIERDTKSEINKYGTLRPQQVSGVIAQLFAWISAGFGDSKGSA